MSGMITLDAPPSDVVKLLRSYPGARITNLPGCVLSVGIGEENGFTVTGKNPGTNIHVADPDGLLDLDVYDFLASQTDWAMYLSGEDDLIDWRGCTPDELGLSVSPTARRKSLVPA